MWAEFLYFIVSRIQDYSAARWTLEFLPFSRHTFLGEQNLLSRFTGNVNDDFPQSIGCFLPCFRYEFLETDSSNLSAVRIAYQII